MPLNISKSRLAAKRSEAASLDFWNVWYLNEPHPGGGAAVSSSSGGVMFNDILGTTLGVAGNDGYSPVSMTAFGDVAPKEGPGSRGSPDALFTGKPHVEGLGYAFLFRNYRAGLGKWLSTDPLGYPDGWNQMAYCNNGLINTFDWLGGRQMKIFDYLSFDQELDEGIPGNGMYIPRVPDRSWSVASLAQVIVNEAQKVGMELIDYVMEKFKDQVASAVKKKIDSAIDTAWIHFMLEHQVYVCSNYNEILPDDTEIFAKIKEVYGGDTMYTPENGWHVSRQSCVHRGVNFIDGPFDSQLPNCYYFTECQHQWKIVLVKE